MRQVTNGLSSVFSTIKLLVLVLTALINLTTAVSRCIMVLRTIRRNKHTMQTEVENGLLLQSDVD